MKKEKEKRISEKENSSSIFEAGGPDAGAKDSKIQSTA